MIDAALLAKFKRRAPLIATQEHLDKAMFLFPIEHHAEIAAQIQPLLTREIMARQVDALPVLKIKDPENPTLHEDTVQRLNNMAARIEQMSAAQLPMLEQIADLKAQVETHTATVEALTAERDSLKAENILLTGKVESAIDANSLKEAPLKTG